MNFPKTMRSTLAAAVLLGVVVLTPRTASAQFGGIVHDPINFITLGKQLVSETQNGATLASQLATAGKMLTQAVQMYGVAMQGYNLAKQETGLLQKGQVLQAAGFLAQHAQIPGHAQWDDTLIKAGGMAMAANSFASIMAPGASMQNRLLLSSSFSTSMLNTLGSCNVAAAANHNALGGLSQMALDMNPGANTAANQRSISNMSLVQQQQYQECQASMAREVAKARLLQMIEAHDRDQSAQTTYTNMDLIYVNKPMFNSNPGATLTAGMN